MYQLLTLFEVDPSRSAEFEAAYGPEGVRAALFGEATGYLGTELFRSAGESGRFLTIDRWDSREAYERFRSSRAEDEAATDALCGGLAERELLLGAIGV